MALSLPALPHASGVVELPGSKSISNRMLLLAALADGVTEIRGALDSDDTRVMVAALQGLGVNMQRLTATDWRITGCGGVFPVKCADIFLGNAGTAVRSLTAVLALSGGQYTVSGVARMHERPIADLVDGLRQIGADVRYSAKTGFPPLQIFPAALHLDAPITVRGDVSSQFLSGLLLALPLTGAAVTLEVTGMLISKPYVDITVNLLRRFGIEVSVAGQRFHIAAGQHYLCPGIVHVEGDASSASYFLAAGVLAGGPVRVEGVGSASIQGDVRFADALVTLGAQVERGDNYISARASKIGRISAFDLDLNHIPDAAMTLAVMALFADATCHLRNIASWRVKETDRLAAMATELRKLGAVVIEEADALHITPPVALTPQAVIDTYDDHRMAMSFALVALGAHGVPVVINDPQCVNKTFPEYFSCLERITAPVIAIDGPSASGKGTVAQRVALQLGFHYLDSGALYRLTALAALRAKIGWDDAKAVAAIAEQLAVEFLPEAIMLDGEEVSTKIRTEEISIGASKIAAFSEVRAALLARQRAFRRWPGLVADGRDMASVVFPEARVKVFLTASVEVRAQRRFKQLIEKELPANMRILLQDLQDRDARDALRSAAPLRQAADAVLIDTTDMDVDAAVVAVLACTLQ